MALLIDGYNLLHVTGIFGRDPGPGSLERSRQALLNFLAASIDPNELGQAAIVFDAPAGLPQTIDHRGLTVHYARNYADADAMLEELIAQHPTPRRLTVVSSDHRVQRAARRRKASPVDSERWYSELMARRRQRGQSAETPQKRDAVLDPVEVAYWLEQFAEPPESVRPPSLLTEQSDERSSESANPFPPGYGEDLLDENDSC
jgi:predicted RNA-binding protein with PIN domain